MKKLLLIALLVPIVALADDWVEPQFGDNFRPTIDGEMFVSVTTTCINEHAASLQKSTGANLDVSSYNNIIVTCNTETAKKFKIKSFPDGYSLYVDPPELRQQFTGGS